MVVERDPIESGGGFSLRECPATPNCVNSQSGVGYARIAPLPVTGDPMDSWRRARAAVVELGGVIMEEKDGYLRTVFTSRFFRFKDDLELLLDRETGVIHVRSASRLGGYDFGVNRGRVEKVRRAYLRGG